jgi:hypothetical protein
MRIRDRNSCNPLKPTREREEKRRWGWVVHDTIFNRGNRAKFTALKVSKQFPLVLLVKVVWRGSKTFGSEEGRDERWSKERSWTQPNCTQLQPPS